MRVACSSSLYWTMPLHLNLLKLGDIDTTNTIITKHCTARA